MSEENIFDNSLYDDDNNENKKQGTIVLDYDLDEDERRNIFQNYSLILCEKCNRKINFNYCKDCYCTETDNVERNRILFGKCKGCFEVMERYSDYSDCLDCVRKHFNKILTSGPVEIKILIN